MQCRLTESGIKFLATVVVGVEGSEKAGDAGGNWVRPLAFAVDAGQTDGLWN
jgi:hypothetical protein